MSPKVGLIFHQNVLFNRFKAFCINFPLVFDPIDPLFHKTLDPIGSNFFCVLNPDTDNLMKYPPHPPSQGTGQLVTLPTHL